MGAIHVKRIYDPPSRDDGRRVLVDRLWPRGLKREAAKIDLWLKEVAPSEELRRWFNHEPRRWTQFQKRYRAELTANSESIKTLRGLIAGAKPVTLLFAAKDVERNNAVALRDYLSSKGAARPRLVHRQRRPDGQ